MYVLLYTCNDNLSEQCFQVIPEWMPSRTEVLRTMRRPDFKEVPDEPEDPESPESPDDKDKNDKSGEGNEKLALAS